MELKLQRLELTPLSTEGELYAGDTFLAYTLELPVRDGLPGSAIPPGTFPVGNRLSPRFGRNVPHIDGIPKRSDILIHWGNYPTDTNGCILVGLEHSKDFVGLSRDAFDVVYRAITAAMSRGESVTLQVMGGIPTERPTNREDVQAATLGEN